MLSTNQISNLHDEALKSWYQNKPEMVSPGEDMDSVVLAQHFRNFTLWNFEDEARRRDVPDSYIAELKRNIDQTNQKRNDLMEVIDQYFLGKFGSIDLSNAEQHSETAGMMIDRLSILSLKIWHMGINANRKDDPEVAEECSKKLAILKIQRADLNDCLERLLAQFEQGKRFFKSYKQFKQYNDPRLNPSLRK